MGIVQKVYRIRTHPYLGNSWPPVLRSTPKDLSNMIDIPVEPQLSLQERVYIQLGDEQSERRYYCQILGGSIISIVPNDAIQSAAPIGLQRLD